MDRVQAYNVATNTWTRKARLPLAQFSSTGTGVIDGKIYFSGRIYSDQQGYGPTGLLFVYDPATNRWTTAAPIPTARQDNTATRVVRNGQPRIEVIGGSPPGNNLQYIP